MPELPEVETTCRGIAPHIVGRTVREAIVREPRLRWPVPAKLNLLMSGARFLSVSRRAKYCLLATERGTLMVHLGMSGSLRIMPADTPRSSTTTLMWCWMMVAASDTTTRDGSAVSTGLNHSNIRCWIIWGLSRCQIPSMGPISMTDRGGAGSP